MFETRDNCKMDINKTMINNGNNDILQIRFIIVAFQSNSYPDE